MPYKRLISTITVRDGQVVKSYGYNFWRPAGGVESILRELDSWQVDEILLLDISRKQGLDETLLAKIGSTNITTPLIYGGGISNQEDIRRLLGVGCDRFVLESLVFRNPKAVLSLSRIFGSQALIASVPMIRQHGDTLQVAITGQTSVPKLLSIEKAAGDIQQSGVSEVLIIDRANEGFVGGYSLGGDPQLEHLFQLAKGILWFGGISAQQAAELLNQPETVGVGVGKSLLERELEYCKWANDISQRDNSSRLRPGFLCKI